MGPRFPPALGFVALGLAVLLLIVAVVQTVLLAGLNSDLDAAQTAQRKADATAAESARDQSDLTKRVAGLEDRTKGTLNSAAVARKVLPSVFRVRAGRDTGTAFAIARVPGGGTLLLTNNHVVASALAAGNKSATIERANESYSVTIDRVDAGRDLAVLRATDNFTPLASAPKPVEPGDPVVVVGAPLGLTDTVTTGVVSAVREQVEGLNTRVIQFDAAINPGNSGGPVINASSQVVGVAQAKIVSDGADGLGLAIPINEACVSLVPC
jgi:putative serine protease PepD